MIDWIVATVPIFKAVHIAGLLIWCGGLLVLPLMLARHGPSIMADDYRLIRRASHVTYTNVVTPAAVIAVIAGTWLIFLRQVFEPWLFAKLAFVALLVVVHAWIGHILVKVAEIPEEHKPPHPALPITAALIAMVSILAFVLAKPDLGWITFPDWLLEPRGGQLPFAVPSR
ncbi:CopD family protein [Pseudoroseicyclus aestuarii]|uniref:Protoporphyrinogen IX oxidase n=1 Tax=Pseudoroseicyclus aestuarii TaxID=1795041 RepID=A0A318ST55_9RHOB|nr:CopD family protein [Pseudoroseicyclus aestuarii]PYE85020.1 putative membrane protein [Pseudoroseicyclus aestuarii]